MTILQVYERYKHLDQLLSDPVWLPGNTLGKIINDLWETIKVQAEIQAAVERVDIPLQPLEKIEIHPETMDGATPREKFPPVGTRVQIIGPTSNIEKLSMAEKMAPGDTSYIHEFGTVTSRCESTITECGYIQIDHGPKRHFLLSDLCVRK